MHNLIHKYFAEVQQCTNKNTIYGENAQKIQRKCGIC